VTKVRLVAAAALAAAAVTGCGSESAEPQPVAATPVAATGSAVTVVRSQFGRILADSRGQALYYFSRERGRASRCYGACETAWPPAPARGRPTATGGARRGLVGTTARRDGSRQLTYAGHPVYLYVADSPGRVLCQNATEFGGAWRVIRADGAVVR
jgi:predicted lipoprotein with Yx(FWY)xxD motif